jgi:4-carboxymuconolactone decarboxylase
MALAPFAKGETARIEDAPIRTRFTEKGDCMAARRPAARLRVPPPNRLNRAQRAMRDAILATRPGLKKFGGPFGVWLHAPQFGDLAQRLGEHCRFKTTLPPRLSEFAILTTARWWRAQFEWIAHAPIAERAGVDPHTIADLRAGRYPKRARSDERAIYEFIAELYRARRVSEGKYRAVLKRLGPTGTVELVGLLGYYAMVSMTLNVFNVPIDPKQPLPFAES